MYIFRCITCKVSKNGIFSEPERMGCGSSAFPTYLSFFSKYYVHFFVFVCFIIFVESVKNENEISSKNVKGVCVPY